MEKFRGDVLIKNTQPPKSTVKIKGTGYEIFSFHMSGSLYMIHDKFNKAISYYFDRQSIIRDLSHSSHSRLIIVHLSIILDHNCNFIFRVEESSRAGKMIFRDNKSYDCGVNEVTAYKGREDSGTHRALPETGDRRISNSSHRRSSRRGTNCVTGIPFSRSPATPSAILPDAIFPLDNKLFDRELSNVIRPSISHAIRFIGNLRKNGEQIRK